MSDETRIFHALYVSSVAQRMDADALDALLRGARSFNRAHGVTGLLVYFDGNFLQALEGPRNVVEPLLARIARDPRHKDLRVMVTYENAAREFSEWAMGLERVPAPLSRQHGIVDLAAGAAGANAGAKAVQPICNVIRTLIRINLRQPA